MVDTLSSGGSVSNDVRVRISHRAQIITPMKEYPPVLSQTAEQFLSFYIMSTEAVRITSNGVFIFNTPVKKRNRRKMNKNKSL